MSEDVKYKGRLKLVKKENKETLEDVCKRVVLENFDNPDMKYYDTYEEYLSSKLYDKFIVANNNVYQVLEKIKYCDDIFSIYEISDGEYQYNVEYYDGCTSFEEAIDFAFYEMESR